MIRLNVHHDTKMKSWMFIPLDRVLLVEELSEFRDESRSGTENQKIINMQVYNEWTASITQDVHRTIRQTGKEMKLCYSCLEVLLPTTRSLLCAIKGLIHFSDLMRVCWMFKIKNLPELDVIRHDTVEESSCNVELPDQPAQSAAIARRICREGTKPTHA